MGPRNNNINNNNIIINHKKVKFTTLDVEEEVYKEPFCSRSTIIKLGLGIIFAGLIVGGVSLGVGLYLLEQSEPKRLNHTTHITTESPTTTFTTQITNTPASTTLTTVQLTSTSTAREPTTSSEPITSSTTTNSSILSSTASTVPSSTTTPTSSTFTTELSTLTSTAISSTTTTATTTQSSTTEIPTTTSEEVTTMTSDLPGCKEKEFRCKSGECIEDLLRCNGKQDCYDETDEYNCTDCRGFVCKNGLCLPSTYSKCNGVFDCSDFSDEMNCGARPGYKECKNGVQIESSKVCNRVDDCGDNSDEIDCSCSGRSFRCPDGQCILKDWLCDGYPDCSNGTDEQNCNKCDSTHFTCTDYSCKDLTTVCNGIMDCPDGKDEDSCVNVGEGELFRNLEVKINDKRYFICADSWTSTIGSAICQHQGYSDVFKVGFQVSFLGIINWLTVSEEKYKATEGRKSFLSYFEPSGACPSRKYVQLACQPAVCGVRKVNFLQPFIAGGQMVPQGKWPWIASVSYLGDLSCGGTLISSQWVVTAGHCVKNVDSFDYTSTPHHMTVTLGSVDRTKGTTLSVSKVVPHPGLMKTVYGVMKNDIALLRLEHPVMYTDLIQPICYDSDEILTETSFCYLSGWGLLSYRQYKSVNLLRETKMVIWSDSRCAKNTVTGESSVDVNTTVCAGYFMGLPTGCQGDSGGPLMCLSKGGNWNLGGVMSSGSNHCGRFAPGIRANRFMKLHKYKDWINDIIFNH